MIQAEKYLNSLSSKLYTCKDGSAVCETKFCGATDQFLFYIDLTVHYVYIYIYIYNILVFVVDDIDQLDLAGQSVLTKLIFSLLWQDS